MKIKEIYEAVKELVREVEVRLDGKSGAEKKEEVVELINERVNIPWIPEGVEALIFGFVVDMVISTLNDYIGQDWINA